MDTAFTSLKNQFLIAMPDLTEGIFANSITYVCEHTPSGAMGIVINRPLDLMLDEILAHLHLSGEHTPLDTPVMAGGPVQTDRGFVLHNTTADRWESSLQITDEIALTTSQDILAAIAEERGPSDSLVALGYAGWGEGQLEEELGANAWLTIPADNQIIFRTPIEQRVKAATAKLGIDISLMAPGMGHA